MKSFLYILPFLILNLTFGCSSVQKMNGIEIITYVEKFHPSINEVEIFGQPFQIIFIRPYKLYITPEYHSSYKLTENKNSEFAHKTLISRDTLYNVLVAKNNLQYGFRYQKDKFKSKEGSKVQIDSFLIEYGFDEESLKFFEGDLGIPIEVI